MPDGIIALLFDATLERIYRLAGALFEALFTHDLLDLPHLLLHCADHLFVLAFTFRS